MLSRPLISQRGFSLVELMVSLTILGFALVMGLPAATSWLQNSKLRSAAESVLSGLQFAKAEAVSRNALVRFQLVSGLGADCELVLDSADWVINTGADPVDGNCDAAPSEEDAPLIVRKRDPTEDPSGMVVASDATDIVFNGLGRPTPAAAVNIDLTNPDVGACAADGGPVTCLRIVVSSAGQIRMCNPNFELPDPQGC